MDNYLIYKLKNIKLWKQPIVTLIQITEFGLLKKNKYIVKLVNELLEKFIEMDIVKPREEYILFEELLNKLCKSKKVKMNYCRDRYEKNIFKIVKFKNTGYFSYDCLSFVVKDQYDMMTDITSRFEDFKFRYCINENPDLFSILIIEKITERTLRDFNNEN